MREENQKDYDKCKFSQVSRDSPDGVRDRAYRKIIVKDAVSADHVLDELDVARSERQPANFRGDSYRQIVGRWVQRFDGHGEFTETNGAERFSEETAVATVQETG